MSNATESKIAAEAIQHPDWCVGGDHEPLTPGAVLGEEPEHFALVANGVGWGVQLTRSVYGGSPYVTLHHDDHGLLADVDRARALGAALLRAADLAEQDGAR